MNPDGQEEGNQKNEGKTPIQQQRYLEAASADYGRAASCVAYGYGRHNHGQQCRLGRDLSRIFGRFDQYTGDPAVFCTGCRRRDSLFPVYGRKKCQAGGKCGQSGSFDSNGAFDSNDRDLPAVSPSASGADFWCSRAGGHVEFRSLFSVYVTFFSVYCDL